MKAFWRTFPLVELWPQVAVLSGLAVAQPSLSRRFAGRWETL